MTKKKLAEELLEGYKTEDLAAPEADAPEEEVGADGEIDTDDSQLLAVVNMYFKKIAMKPAAVKADKLEKLVHRLINSMIEMPRGEKEARSALKLAIKDIANRGIM